jgi:hypothetical protein
MIMLPSVVVGPDDNVAGPAPFFRVRMAAFVVVVAVDRWATAALSQLSTYPQPGFRRPA